MLYYNEKLVELQEKMARFHKLESSLEKLEEQKKALKDRAEEWKRAKEKEQEDVDRLEGRSLANFFYRFVGKQEERISKEKEEAYAAAVKYDAAVRELEAVEYDIRKAKEELGELWGCDRQYQALLQEKMEAIKASGRKEAEELFRLEEQMAELSGQKKEIQEAISAGKRAENQAQSILDELDHAEGWGTWDLVGGGLMTDMIKHSHLDGAQEKVEQLQVLLQRFRTELDDVRIRADMQVNVDGFLRFADYFFDGLFADWTVLKRIGESKEQVLQVKRQLDEAIDRLEELLRKNEQECSALKAQKADVIWDTAVELPKQ